MGSLVERMLGAGSIKEASVLADSTLFNEKDKIPTEIPALNIALGGSLDGGLTPGILMLCGPPKHFKSLMGLILVQTYMKRYKDAVCLFFDSEFGITPQYVSSVGIDTSRVVHIPIQHIEQLKFDIVKRLEEVKRGDKVIIFIDSIGNLASKKEVEDAIDAKSVADMTRAKALKSLFRIINPHFPMKDIPCIVINHTYTEIALYPKEIVGGGRGSYYSSNTIWIIGRSQEKEGTELVGYAFNINVEKSRYVLEKSKIPLVVRFDSGIDRWTGLLDIAIELGFVKKPSVGWFSYDGDKRKFRKEDTQNLEFWEPLVCSPDFQEAIRKKYQLGVTNMITKEIDDDDQDVE